MAVLATCTLATGQTSEVPIQQQIRDQFRPYTSDQTFTGPIVPSSIPPERLVDLGAKIGDPVALGNSAQRRTTTQLSYQSIKSAVAAYESASKTKFGPFEAADGAWRERVVVAKRIVAPKGTKLPNYPVGTPDAIKVLVPIRQRAWKFEEGTYTIALTHQSINQLDDFAVGIRPADRGLWRDDYSDVLWQVDLQGAPKDAEGVQVPKEKRLRIFREGIPTITDFSVDVPSVQRDPKTDQVTQYLDGRDRRDPIHAHLSANLYPVLYQLSRRASRANQSLLPQNEQFKLSIDKALFSSERLDKQATIPINFEFAGRLQRSITSGNPVYGVDYLTSQDFVNNSIVGKVGYEYRIGLSPSYERRPDGSRVYRDNEPVPSMIPWSKVKSAPKIRLFLEAPLILNRYTGVGSGVDPVPVFSSFNGRIHGILSSEEYKINALKFQERAPYLTFQLDGWLFQRRVRDDADLAEGAASVTFGIPVTERGFLAVKYETGANPSSNFVRNKGVFSVSLVTKQ